MITVFTFAILCLQVDKNNVCLVAYQRARNPSPHMQDTCGGYNSSSPSDPTFATRWCDGYVCRVHFLIMQVGSEVSGVVNETERRRGGRARSKRVGKQKEGTHICNACVSSKTHLTLFSRGGSTLIFDTIFHHYQRQLMRAELSCLGLLHRNKWTRFDRLLMCTSGGRCCIHT